MSRKLRRDTVWSKDQHFLSSFKLVRFSLPSSWTYYTRQFEIRKTWSALATSSRHDSFL